ncbi:MAG: hypothetical protein Q8P60_15595, partial [Pseudorhodobacter sp.]|nr:hypothetical protein [Pseudorhodobacter sp.]
GIVPALECVRSSELTQIFLLVDRWAGFNRDEYQLYMARQRRPINRISVIFTRSGSPSRQVYSGKSIPAGLLWQVYFGRYATTMAGTRLRPGHGFVRPRPPVTTARFRRR